ncbi:3-oxoadipate CoA-transferase beta subunit [Tistlia consotensis]|uniref:3-oxoadipate CoA-transferase beta subunit n=1 Tax=Tistlia consotensis USBA 355 TaxID=560819 RepID=A0A1Y6BV50_9PROT|nr:3-oxoacid CoA-transferase subunit B [Tistlia consotensis]SMF28866.1 3-oxoadipate CoA-transferase beta subunit [Tistlia consotensis USBA 355]SNR91862.1 3-oxoadipate CoA-transferase beta subunit [Tistlia consotensis]
MSDKTRTGLSRAQMAWRAAQDIPDGAYVNLGIGIPELVADYVPAGREVVYHTENGILGFGPAPEPGQEDPDLINAGKKPVTLLPGAAFFHHADSFAMIRGGHIDYCILGAMQVAANGDIANWSTGAAGAIPAVGGAMDLVAGVRNVLVITEHTTREGEPKLMERCSYPLTAPGVVKRVFTTFGVFDVTASGFLLQEIAPGVPVEQVRAATAAPLAVADSLKEVAAPQPEKAAAHV